MMRAMAPFVVLLLVGSLLLAAEMFVPGGIVGAVGIACLVAAVVVAYAAFDRSTAHVVLSLMIFAGLAGAAAWLRYFPDSRLARRFAPQGHAGAPDLDYRRFLGATGVAETPLRPAGKVRIGIAEAAECIDVVSDGPFVDQGTAVQVVEARGNRLVVRVVGEADSP